MKPYLFSLVFAISLPALGAGTFKVAAIFPDHEIGHVNCTCGSEGACISEAVIKRARKEGMKISFTLANKEWDIFKTVAAAEKVVKDRYDAAIGPLVSADALAIAPIFEAGGIPFIVPTATNPEVTKGRKLVTRIPGFYLLCVKQLLHGGFLSWGLNPQFYRHLHKISYTPDLTLWADLATDYPFSNANELLQFGVSDFSWHASHS